MITLQFRIKKYLPLLFLIFISTIFLSNCTRLPKPSIKNKTILVVIDEFVNTSLMPPQMRMKFHITRSGLKGNFFVTPSNGNAIIPTLEPGNYRVEGYSSQPIGTASKGRSKIKPLSINFELKRNQITVLNKKLVYTQKPYDSRGGWRANWDFKTVTNSEKQKALSLLRTDENFSLWRIYEEKKYVQKPKPEPKPEVDYDCVARFYMQASRENTVNSFRNFLSKCTDKNNSYYLAATRKLKNIQIQEQEQQPKKSYVEPSVVLPKVTASPPKVTDQSEKSKTIIIPTGSLGKISEVRKKILEKTLESKLDDYFDIVPKELFEEAQEQAFQELDADECTEERCIAKIQEILQVPNAFQLILMVEEEDTQISLTWNDMQRKRVEEDYCEGCKTKDLRKMIEGLVEKLVKGNN
jgi:hypothetical protein